MNILLPQQVKTALNLLTENGYEAFIVGGCVRDSILGITPLDWDITTNAIPKQILSVFENYRTIKTGIKHGTVTVIIQNLPLEITTYRIDGEYLNNRHPDSVKFCFNLKEDLNRRDFTINSLAFNSQSGIVDISDGVNDINSKIIRCVGNPDIRFKEDALRILRALRFSSTLGFNIEQNTSDSILRNAHLLRNVSKERVSSELLKILCGKNVVNVLLKYRNVFATIIPEIEPMFDFQQNNKHHIFDVWEHTVYAIGFSEPNPIVRLTLLLHDIGKPHCYTIDTNSVGHFYGHGEFSADIASKVLEDLKLSNNISQTILTLVRYHDCELSPDEKLIKKRLAKFSEPVLRLLVKVQNADSLAHNPAYSFKHKDINQIEETIDKVIANNECFSLEKLAVNGTDLIALGIPKGRVIGEILNDLLNYVIDNKISNNKDKLLSKAKEMYGGI